MGCGWELGAVVLESEMLSVLTCGLKTVISHGWHGYDSRRCQYIRGHTHNCMINWPVRLTGLAAQHLFMLQEKLGRVWKHKDTIRRGKNHIVSTLSVALPL